MSLARGRSGPAVVVSAGKMQKTVKARQTKEVWNKLLRKVLHYHAQSAVFQGLKLMDNLLALL